MWPRAGSLGFLTHFLGYKILLLNWLPSKLQGFCLCLSTAGTIITWCSVDAGDLSALPSPFHADVPKNSISNHVTPFRSSCLGDRGNHRSDYFPSENRNYGKDPGLQFCPQAAHALPSLATCAVPGLGREVGPSFLLVSPQRTQQKRSEL